MSNGCKPRFVIRMAILKGSIMILLFNHILIYIRSTSSKFQTLAFCSNGVNAMPSMLITPKSIHAQSIKFKWMTSNLHSWALRTTIFPVTRTLCRNTWRPLGGDHYINFDKHIGCVCAPAPAATTGMEIARYGDNSGHHVFLDTVRQYKQEIRYEIPQRTSMRFSSEKVACELEPLFLRVQKGKAKMLWKHLWSELSLGDEQHPPACTWPPQ